METTTAIIMEPSLADTPGPAAIDQPLDDSLVPGGPTARQECFLRRHHLWSEGLTKNSAGRLIGDFLEEKRQKHLQKAQAATVTSEADATASEPPESCT